ncbi:MAG TPA: dTMP kinase [Candidatus Nanoarchaeia archaeon]|nr:dTMP kinase [Candidatus Nanoarchaeia archaeon]
MKSLFIVFDGMDGAGKGEMIQQLTRYLAKYRVLVTKEPTEGPYGNEARELLENEADPMENAELCLDLFVKDRKEHLETQILPFLKKPGSIVISDRYYYSTIAFQTTQGLDRDRVIAANSSFRSPDITFILDLPVEVAMQRISARGNKIEKFEQQAFMEKLRRNFLDLPKTLKDTIQIIDASRSVEEVFLQIKNRIDNLL